MTYIWKAIYNDDTELDQYDGESENLFGDINEGELKKFQLIDGEDIFELDFVANKIVHGGEDVLTVLSGDFKYFRRNKVVMTNSKIQGPPYTCQYLGMGSKRIKICPDGAFSIEE